MNERTKAILQLQKAHAALAAARESFEAIGAPPTISGTAAHIEELTATFFGYVLQEYGDTVEGFTSGTESKRD